MAIRCGLLGKHASRRDSIALEAPEAFLSAWEPWLQSGLSTSRERLGRDWQAAFLSAPIWRFWLGSDICGTTVLGAFMASLDQIGRYFPLTVFAAADRALAIPPPEFEAHGAWFEATEAFLLATLVPSMSFERLAAALAALPPPLAYPPVAARDPVAALAIGGAIGPFDGHAPGTSFASLRLADWAAAYAGRAFWWTAGGIGFRPIALATRHLPHPELFTAMLTGDFRAFAG